MINLTDRVRMIPMLLKPLRQRDDLGLFLAKMFLQSPHTNRIRPHARHHRGTGGVTNGDLAMRIGEHRTPCAECINMRCDRQFVAENPHARAQVIHRNEQHIWPLRRVQRGAQKQDGQGSRDHLSFINDL